MVSILEKGQQITKSVSYHTIQPPTPPPNKNPKAVKDRGWGGGWGGGKGGGGWGGWFDRGQRFNASF